MSEQLALFSSPETNENGDFSEKCRGKPRLNLAVRNQVELMTKSLDELLPKEHLARDIWRFVESLDLSSALKQILSTEGNAGRPATDPKILLALWLFATVKGISSARLIDEYCSEHDAFKWICGGVKVNYHTISDFRSFQGEHLDILLIQSVAVLSKANVISLEAVSQDGIRVRACAGGGSFKREETLQSNLELAEMLVLDLKEEAKKNPGVCKTRVEAAQMRSAKEKMETLQRAVSELEEVRKTRIQAKKKEQRRVKEEDLKNTRASMTDPEARIMKMADGGFRPAYNVQFASTNIGKAIIRVDVTKSGSDQKETFGMIKQVEEIYGEVPKKWLQDAGYSNQVELEKVGSQYKKCKIYMPVKAIKNSKENRYTKRATDSEISGEWRERMDTEEAKEIYKDRASTAEFVNAQTRNRGLQQFLVKGLAKVKAVALLYALVQNMMIVIKSW